MNVAGPFESTPTDPDFLLPTSPNGLYKILAFASGELAFLCVCSPGRCPGLCWRPDGCGQGHPSSLKAGQRGTPYSCEVVVAKASASRGLYQAAGGPAGAHG